MYEARGNYRVFVAQGTDLPAALQEAANATAGIQLLDRAAHIRVLHNFDEEGHSIVLMVEGD